MEGAATGSPEVARAMSIDGMKRRKAATMAVLSLVAVPVAGCTRPPAASTQSRDDRVNAAFAADARAIKQKEGSAPASSAHLMVGTADLADGSRISLWVSDPAANVGIKSSCWYLDMETSTAATAGYGGCGMPTTTVDLNRRGGVVIGSVGIWKAQTVHIETPVATAEFQVTGGYFLVSPPVAGTARSTFTITLLDASAQPIGVVQGLTAPGTATPTT